MKRTRCEIFNGCNCESCLETSLQLKIEDIKIEKMKKKAK